MADSKDAATRHWFTKCRAAMLSEVPKEIQDALDEAERLPDSGEGVRAVRDFPHFCRFFLTVLTSLSHLTPSFLAFIISFLTFLGFSAQERRQLEERLGTLVKKAVQEMRSLGRSKDFKAVETALLKYGECAFTRNLCRCL